MACGVRPCCAASPPSLEPLLPEPRWPQTLHTHPDRHVPAGCVGMPPCPFPGAGLESTVGRGVPVPERSFCSGSLGGRRQRRPALGLACLARQSVRQSKTMRGDGSAVLAQSLGVSCCDTTFSRALPGCHQPAIAVGKLRRTGQGGCSHGRAEERRPRSPMAEACREELPAAFCHSARCCLGSPHMADISPVCSFLLCPGPSFLPSLHSLLPLVSLPGPARASPGSCTSPWGRTMALPTSVGLGLGLGGWMCPGNHRAWYSTYSRVQDSCRPCPGPQSPGVRDVEQRGQSYLILVAARFQSQKEVGLRTRGAQECSLMTLGESQAGSHPFQFSRRTGSPLAR